MTTVPTLSLEPDHAASHPTAEAARLAACIAGRGASVPHCRHWLTGVLTSERTFPIVACAAIALLFGSILFRAVATMPFVSGSGASQSGDAWHDCPSCGTPALCIDRESRLYRCGWCGYEVRMTFDARDPGAEAETPAEPITRGSPAKGPTSTIP